MTDEVELFAFAVIGAVSGYLMWRRNMRAANLMDGTATSRLASAAKGYVELIGTARAAGGPPVRDPVQFRECLWFKLVTEKRSLLSRSQQWEVERRVASTEPLALEDGTGSCLIVPGEAKIDDWREVKDFLRQRKEREDRARDTARSEHGPH